MIDITEIIARDNFLLQRREDVEKNIKYWREVMEKEGETPRWRQLLQEYLKEREEIERELERNRQRFLRDFLGLEGLSSSKLKGIKVVIETRW